MLIVLLLVRWSEAVKSLSYSPGFNVTLSYHLIDCGSETYHNMVALPVLLLVRQTRHHLDQIRSTGTCVLVSIRFCCVYFVICFQIFMRIIFQFLIDLFHNVTFWMLASFFSSR